MSRHDLLTKGLADANRWYKLNEPLIRARQNIERVKKSGIEGRFNEGTKRRIN